jgi:asparagine synthase (glutamine-hydrolysing)
MVRFDGAALDVGCIGEAARIMRHRGPDGEGFLLANLTSGAHALRNGDDTPPNIQHPHLTTPSDFTPDLALAHRRLAILDLSPNGHEPMSVNDGALWLTFNGEIYNYLEIRDDLRALGYTFHTECDAEVILQAYDAWGYACLERFIGMFAFALWDRARRRLWCVRDRFGVKPFYYAVSGGQFAFASEIKALRVLLPEACTPDMAQLFWFARYGRVFNPPYTFFEGVRELAGGHYLVIEDGRVSDPIRYWDIDLERARATYDYSDPEGEFLSLLRDSVRLRLRSDVPVGTCLSGGLDSSAIVALATEGLNGGRMNSFSSIYAVKGLDERRYINLVSEKCGTIRHETTPQPANFIPRLEKMTWHQDIPTASPTLMSQYAVMELAHGVVTVLLDGQGADELLAGYLSHVVFHLRDLRRRDPARWVREQAAFMREVYPRFFPYFSPREFASRARHTLAHGIQPPHVLTADADALAGERETGRSRRKLDSGDALNDHLYQAVMQESIPALLHYEDRNSMAFGIEARVPFLDHRLAEFALGVPGDLKVKGATTKLFARRALSRVLPDEIAWRKDKLGYPIPFGHWLRTDTALQADSRAVLLDGVSKRGWIQPARVERLWRDHLSGGSDHSRQLYALITAEQWIRWAG